jgi:hypothetical protein
VNRPAADACTRGSAWISLVGASDVPRAAATGASRAPKSRNADRKSDPHHPNRTKSLGGPASAAEIPHPSSVKTIVQKKLAL